MTERTAASVAYEALNLGKQNEKDITNHEELCAERYKNIHAAIGDIKGILKWAGGAMFTIIIGLLSFLAREQFNANHDAQKTAADKIELLERQLHANSAASGPATPPPGS